LIVANADSSKEFTPPIATEKRLSCFHRVFSTRHQPKNKQTSRTGSRNSHSAKDGGRATRSADEQTEKKKKLHRSETACIVDSFRIYNTVGFTAPYSALVHAHT
jgi:hypothetical protein